MPDPRAFLNIMGHVSNDTSGGYTRFFSVGPQSEFIGADISQLQTGSNIPASPRIGNAVVPILSRLAISQYLNLPPPITINPRPGPIVFKNDPVVIDPGPVFKPPFPPVALRPIVRRTPSYTLTDGTVLTTILEDGRVIGLSGKASDGHTYSLTTAHGTTKGNGRQKGIEVAWLYAYLLISKDGAPPLKFGFSYSAESFLINILSAQNNLENNIEIDFAAAVIENQTGNIDGSANLKRILTYYTNTYVDQTLTVPAIESDPQFHLPNEATLWPFLPDVALFADAFNELGGQAPQLPLTPLVALGSLDFFTPPPAVGILSAQITSSIIPACGLLAATCLSSDDGAVSLKSAANWLANLLLSTSTGKAAIQVEVDAYHALLVQSQYGPILQPTTGKDIEPKPDIPPMKG